MNRLDYKDAPKGTMAIPTLEGNCDGCVYCAGNCAYPSNIPTCFTCGRVDKTSVVFVLPASEHYARIALERVYESIEVSVHKARVEIEALATSQFAATYKHSFGPLDRMLLWLDIKYDLFGN